MIIKMISRGTFPRKIMSACNIPYGYTDADVIVNYGMQGRRLQRYLENNPFFDYNNHPCILNKDIYGNKLECILSVHNDIRCPESKSRFNGVFDALEEWIAKPYWSFGGKNIISAIEHANNGGPQKCYYQKSLQYDRLYEIRVHAFKWMPLDTWSVQKKKHEDGNNALTWNHHTGGRFITINDHNKGVFLRCKEAAKIAMNIFGYQFGSADFIIDKDYNDYFLEWNLATGVTVSAEINCYINAFNTLKQMSFDNIKSLIERR